MKPLLLAFSILVSGCADRVEHSHQVTLHRSGTESSCNLVTVESQKFVNGARTVASHTRKSPLLCGQAREFPGLIISCSCD
jgi:hypothetical protein